MLSITIVSGVTIANALTLSPGSEELIKKSDYVVVGKILSFKEIPAKQETEYLVQVDEMLKPLPTHGGGFHGNMTVVAQGTRNPTGILPMHEDTKFFDMGDSALLFLDFIEIGKTEFDKGRFEVSLYSFTTKGNCTGSQLLQQMYGPAGLSISQNNQSKHLYTNKPVDVTFYVYNPDLISEKKDFEFQVFTPNGKLSEKRQVQLQECKRSAKVSWSFVPTIPGKYTFSAVIGNREGGSESYGGILIEDYVDSPLKQYKRESRDDIKCQIGLDILRKATSGFPACVKPQTKTELIKRGWGSETWPFNSVQ